MHVPQHITITGDSEQEPRQRLNSTNDKYIYHMNVPERILVTGGNETRADRAPPSEVMLDRMPVLYPTAVSCHLSMWIFILGLILGIVVENALCKRDQHYSTPDI